jgi:ABC-2 type transport system permease protein
VRALRAFPTLLRVGFADAVAYRAEMVVWMLSMTMPLVSLALWSAVAASEPVGRYRSPDLVAYFLSVMIVRQLTGSWVVWDMIQEIRTGSLVSRLLKPMHPFVSYAAANLAAVPMRALLVVPITVILLATVGGRRFPQDPVLALTLVLSLVGAWLMTFFIMTMIGSMSFFMESSYSVFDVWMLGFMLLSGYLVPLDLFPRWVGHVADALPFRYMCAFPVEVLTGLTTRSRALRELAIQWAYAAGIALVALSLWRSGVRRYSAFGG